MENNMGFGLLLHHALYTVLQHIQGLVRLVIRFQRPHHPALLPPSTVTTHFLGAFTGVGSRSWP